MNKFYFTYGTSPAFPFQGGWTLVYAPDLSAAIQIFKAYHPHPDGSGIVNCSDYYTEDDFEKGDTFKNGNRGSFCHEVIGPRNLIQSVGDQVFILSENIDCEQSEPKFYTTQVSAHKAMLALIAEALGVEENELAEAADENDNISNDDFIDLFHYNGEVNSNSAWVKDIRGCDFDWTISSKALQFED